ncbi:aspartyl-phosphate phosphatase Spo0E family protein [Paenibacillus pasadenensis]|nr:aspartyl-phosphate phosphatase Spo0E family protein [Paenibacillus pasadenensis]
MARGEEHILNESMSKYEMLERLNDLRKRLHQAAEERGSLIDPEVLAISEEADQLIVKLQQQQRDTRISMLTKKGPLPG